MDKHGTKATLQVGDYHYASCKVLYILWGLQHYVPSYSNLPIMSWTPSRSAIPARCPSFSLGLNPGATIYQPVTGVPKQKCGHYSITKDSTSPKTQCGFRSCHWKTCCPWKYHGKIDGWNQRLMKLPPTIGLGIWPSLRYSSTDWKTSFSALALPGCRPQKTNRTSEAFRPQKESSNTKIQAFQLFPLFPLFQLDDDHVVDFALLLGHSDNAQDSRQFEPQSACTFKKGRRIFTGKKSSVSLLLWFQTSACAMNLDHSVLSQMQLDSCNPTLKLRSICIWR